MKDQYQYIHDSNKRLEDIDIKNYRYIVVYYNGMKELVARRKDLKDIINEKEAEIDLVLQLDNRTDRYVDWETKNRYRVGVNESYDDADYCSCVNEQYTIYVLAENKKDAIEKAVKQCNERYNEEDRFYYDAVWIDTYHVNKEAWSHETLVR